MTRRLNPTIDDGISQAVFSLLLKEPFYAHVLAGMPRVISERTKTLGLCWVGQHVVLVINPIFFLQKLDAEERVAALKHEVLHLAFRHIFRKADHDPALHSIAADLVVDQLIAPLKLPAGYPTLEWFPELNLPENAGLDDYYRILAALRHEMRQNGYTDGEPPPRQSIPKWALATGKPKSAMVLAALLAGKGEGGGEGGGEGSGSRGDDSGWHDGKNALEKAAGEYAVGSLLIRSRDRTPAHKWGSMPAELQSALAMVLAERQPKIDWARVVRIFCASSGRTKLKTSVKRISKRYGTRPGIKVQRLQRLLVAVDTSGSIDQNMVECFFAEIHGAWRAGASVTVVECDAEVQRSYDYQGKTPTAVQGGGGTAFEPVFVWMLTQRSFDGCLYLTDGCGPAPATRPACKLLWVVTTTDGSSGLSADDDESALPFGPTVKLPTTTSN